MPDPPAPARAGMPHGLSPSKGKIQPDIKQPRFGDGRGQIVRVPDDIGPGHIKIKPPAPSAQAQGRPRQVAARDAKGVFREDMPEIKGGIPLKRPKHPGKGGAIRLRQPQRQLMLRKEPAVAEHHRFPQPPHGRITAKGVYPRVCGGAGGLGELNRNLGYN